jgi:hypothetical protein
VNIGLRSGELFLLLKGSIPTKGCREILQLKYPFGKITGSRARTRSGGGGGQQRVAQTGNRIKTENRAPLRGSKPK